MIRGECVIVLLNTHPISESVMSPERLISMRWMWQKMRVLVKERKGQEKAGRRVEKTPQKPSHYASKNTVDQNRHISRKQHAVVLSTLDDIVRWQVITSKLCPT